MDELTLLRNTRDTRLEPGADTLERGRVTLLARIGEAEASGSPERIPERIRRARPGRVLPRLAWSAGGVAAAIVAAMVVGSVALTAQSAHAAEVLRTAAGRTLAYADLVVGSGQYLLSERHAQDHICGLTDCTEQIWTTFDVYMPAEADQEWVLQRGRAESASAQPGEVETVRALGGEFYGPGSSWGAISEIPTEGAAAYAWIDSRYAGGSASRDEDNFVRIVDILSTGLVPAAQRAALLQALASIPGVSATDGVQNLDGATGVAIGRTEPLRNGTRQEIIIDPDTGLVIGQRQVTGLAVFGVGAAEVWSHSAIKTSVVDTAP